MKLDIIGLIGAMDEEIDLIILALDNPSQTVKAGIRFYEGLFHRKRVVLCKCGVGKVNASVCSQILIDSFHVDCIWFTGVAGALNPGLQIGDIVISTECMQHDMDVTALGFRRGEIPYADKSIFPADSKLIELALESCRKRFHNRSMIGRILSGDQFIADRGIVKLLHEQLGGDCTEMEGAAVAQVCSMNQVPYVVIRSMSDKADGSAHMNFAEFTLQAAQHSFQIIDDMIINLGGDLHVKSNGQN